MQMLSRLHITMLTFLCTHIHVHVHVVHIHVHVLPYQAITMYVHVNGMFIL